MNKAILIAAICVFGMICFSCQNQKELPDRIFLLAGQSNMDGCGIGEELPQEYQNPPQNVKVWNNKEESWVALGFTSFAIRRNQQFGPEMAFSHQMASAFPENNIRIIKTSAGGTKLFKHWLPDSVMYNRFIQNIDKALVDLNKSNQSFEICGFIWMQGESDSETLEMAEAYEENLMQLFAAVRKKTQKPELPIVMGRISSSLLKETPWVFDHTKIVQKAQESVANQDPHVHIINTDTLSTLWDNTHFDTKAQLTLGKQMARIMLTEINKK